MAIRTLIFERARQQMLENRRRSMAIDVQKEDARRKALAAAGGAQ